MAMTIVPSLDILKLPDGGYMVGDGYRGDGSFRGMRFASTSIDEALKYIKATLEQKPAK